MTTTDLHRESVFIVVSVAVHIVADQLLAVLILDGNHRLEEFHQRLPLKCEIKRLTEAAKETVISPCSL